jgi:all-trans-retinol dehydrogenase (NAD+)
MTDFDDKTILITGGASGIGRLIALKAARLGSTVVIWDLDEARLDAVLRDLRRCTSRAAYGYVCDVSDQQAVAERAATVAEAVGDVDILVNNAGVVSGTPLLETSNEQIERTFKVNVLALYWVTKAFLPGMVRRNAGHIVNVSSAGGLIGVPRQTDYSASKHAVVGFNESLRVELHRLAPGIRTTVVCPFYIDTGMFAGAKTRIPLLLPILHEDDVATRVVRAVRKNKEQLLMPPMVHLVSPLRLLPVPVFDLIASVLGVHDSMDDFVGRAQQ